MFCWLGALFVALFIGSALLRAGIGLANRAIGHVKKEGIIGYADWDSDDSDEFDVIVRVDTEFAIPEPGIFLGMGITFLASLVAVGVAFALSLILDGPVNMQDWPLQVAGVVIEVAAGFVVLMGLLTWMLPTQPKWAALASLFTYLIVIAVGVLIYGLVTIMLR
ncbi:MAG: hypothetical protein K8U57_13085 [Planctomycetes bacterium]|nr:hypothetical protein [Planctomycetota bacterium]